MSSNFQRTAAAGCQGACCDESALAPLEWEQNDDELIGSTEEEVEAEVAIDSGAVDNVIFPEGLPNGVTVEPNTTASISRALEAAASSSTARAGPRCGTRQAEKLAASGDPPTSRER